MKLITQALLEHAKKEREAEERRAEEEQQMCSDAIRSAYRTFGFYPETAVYTDRRVELSFDHGDVKLARVFEGRFDGAAQWEWRVLFTCERCGESILGPAVTDLAGIGEALTLGLDGCEHHYCAPRDTGRMLSEYMAEEVA